MRSVNGRFEITLVVALGLRRLEQCQGFRLHVAILRCVNFVNFIQNNHRVQCLGCGNGLRHNAGVCGAPTGGKPEDMGIRAATNVRLTHILVHEHSLDLPANVFELFNKGNDLCKHARLLAVILRVQRAHLWQKCQIRRRSSACCWAFVILGFLPRYRVNAC